MSDGDRVNVEQAVFLVGGQGTRLGPLTKNKAKPVLEVGGRPFLDYLLEEASRQGMKRALLLCGYRAGDFAALYEGRTIRGMTISTIVEKEPAGTGGALALAADWLEGRFFLVNGDSLFDFNWLALEAGPANPQHLVRMALARGVSGDRYGRVTVVDGRVTGFTPSGSSSEPINAGVYLMQREVLSYLKPAPCSLEREVLPALAAQGAIGGLVIDGAFIDIGLPNDFERAQTFIPETMQRPVAFLDRDGIVNEDTGYVHRADEVRWVDGSREAIRWLNDAGYLVFIVTNQAGVARGYYTEEHVHELHAWMNAELRRFGAHIDAFEHCPFHPEGVVEKYRGVSDLRKPEPGMILKLQREWSTDPSRSFLVGDRDSDVAAAIAAGLPGFKFPGGNLLEFVRKCAAETRKTGVAG